MSGLFNDIKNKALNAAIGIADSFTPILKESKFRETGFITPDEFVAAGDFLVHHCPTWKWASGDKLKIKDYLPRDKQFLITKNVPCSRRCTDLMDIKNNVEKVVEEDTGDGGWVDTHFLNDDQSGEYKDNAVIEDISDTKKNKTETKNIQTSNDNRSDDNDDDDDDDDDDEPVDMENYNENIIDDDDDVVTVNSTKLKQTAQNPITNDDNKNSNIIHTRTYDLNITYDNYYRTPRLWLSGYDENQKPLNVDQMYEDISEDHAKKTVTFESHPHIPSVQMASIHPCRHAEVMKKLINMFAESGKELEVYAYVMVFLKFVQSVIPTIEYDYTRNISI